MRIKGGVYSYIQKILDRFRGEILLGAEVAAIQRSTVGVTIELADRNVREFDKVVFATPPDRVLKLLANPHRDEIARFESWQGNYVQTLLHTNASMYAPYRVREGSEFDFFETEAQHGYWGYNVRLNQLCGIDSPIQYSLSFNLESLIDPDRILHIQQHHTPLYTVEAFRHRQEIIATNGDYHTYHVGAYLGDGLHEGAVTSAMQVAAMIAASAEVRSQELVKS